jgi:ribonuclease VapC
LISVDASAVLAILLQEPEAAIFKVRLQATGGLMSPVNHWEVLARAYALGGRDGAVEAQRLLQDLNIEVAELNEAASTAAFEAFVRFGKGNGGPLNLGDCFAYALAQREGDGLLFKGDEFPRTDVKSAA